MFLLLTCLYTSLFAQKTFDNGLLSFTYPSYFKNSEISNAEHMVLKLESNKYTFTISLWDYKYKMDESVDAWDDAIYNNYNGFSPGNSKFVSIERCLISTKTGKEHSLKIKTNSYENKIKFKHLFYLIIKNGYLFVFSTTSEGTYTKNTPTTYEDNLIKGVSFKNIRKSKNNTELPQEVLNQIKNTYMSFCKELNEQTPLYVDDITTLISAVFIDWTITITYKVSIDTNDYTEQELKLMMDEMREYGKNNAKILLKRGSYDLNINDFLQLMEMINLRFRMNYIDTNNIPIGSIVYGYKDFSDDNQAPGF